MENTSSTVPTLETDRSLQTPSFQKRQRAVRSKGLRSGHVSDRKSKRITVTNECFSSQDFIQTSNSQIDELVYASTDRINPLDTPAEETKSDYSEFEYIPVLKQLHIPSIPIPKHLQARTRGGHSRMQKSIEEPIQAPQVPNKSQQREYRYSQQREQAISPSDFTFGRDQLRNSLQIQIEELEEDTEKEYDALSTSKHAQEVSTDNYDDANGRTEVLPSPVNSYNPVLKLAKSVYQFIQPAVSYSPEGRSPELQIQLQSLQKQIQHEKLHSAELIEELELEKEEIRNQLIFASQTKAALELQLQERDWELRIEKEEKFSLKSEMSALISRLNQLDKLEYSTESQTATSESDACTFLLNSAKLENENLLLKSALSQRGFEIASLKRLIEKQQSEIMGQTKKIDRLINDQALTIGYYQEERDRLQHTLDTTRAWLDDLKEQYRFTSSELEKLKNLEEDYEIRISVLSQSRSKSEVECKKAIFDKAQAEDEAEIYLDRLQAAEQANRELQEEIQQLKLLTLHEPEDDLLFELQAQCQQAESEKLRLYTTLHEERRKFEQLSDELDSIRGQLQDCQSELLQKQQVVEWNSSENQGLTQNCIKIQEAFDDLENKYTALQDRYQKKVDKAQIYKQGLVEMQSSNEVLEMEVKQLQLTQNKIREEMLTLNENYNSELEEAEKQKRELENELYEKYNQEIYNIKTEFSLQIQHEREEKIKSIKQIENGNQGIKQHYKEKLKKAREMQKAELQQLNEFNMKQLEELESTLKQDIEYWKREKYRFESEAEDYRIKAEELDAILDEKRENEANLAQQVQNITLQISQLQDTHNEELQKNAQTSDRLKYKCADLKQELQDLKYTFDLLQSEYSQLKNEKSHLQIQKNALQEKYDTIQSSQQAYDSTIDQLYEKITQLKSKKNSIQQANNLLNETSAQQSIQIQELQNEMIKQQESYQSSLSGVQSSYNEAQQQLEEKEYQLSEMEQMIEILTKEKRLLYSELQQIQSKQNQTDSIYTKEKNQLNAQIQELLRNLKIAEEFRVQAITYNSHLENKLKSFKHKTRSKRSSVRSQDSGDQGILLAQIQQLVQQITILEDENTALQQQNRQLQNKNPFSSIQ